MYERVDHITDMVLAAQTDRQVRTGGNVQTARPERDSVSHTFFSFPSSICFLIVLFLKTCSSPFVPRNRCTELYFITGRMDSSLF